LSRAGHDRIRPQKELGMHRAATRHPWPVRLWHWATALACGVLFLTGFLIFDIHPHLYWGDDGHEAMPAVLSLTGTHLDEKVPHTDLQVGRWHWNTTGVLGAVLDAGDSGKYLLVAMPWDDWQFGASRGWHFMLAWLLGLSLPTYVLYLVVSGRLASMLLPALHELSPTEVARDAWRHMRLKRATGAAASRYNVLQKLSYLLVIFVLIPAIIVSGLTMSNTVTAAYPDLISLFGGRQSARTIHFLAAVALALFFAVHLFQVLAGGPLKLTRGMVTGRYTPDPEDAR
jgi:thiosulfate reductase cytochrome b subunit